MKKILYYLRLLLFIPYLVIIFLLIDNLYKMGYFCNSDDVKDIYDIQKNISIS